MTAAPAAALPAGITELAVYEVPMRTRFRGIDVRDGVLLRGPAGWGEFSPFWDYDVAESRRWWAAAVEAATVGWPAPLRDSVPVNVTVPAVDAERAHAIVAASTAGTVTLTGTDERTGAGHPSVAASTAAAHHRRLSATS